MEFLIDPNVAYIFIVAGVMLALLTVIVPGTGLPEAGMIICLGVTWYELSHLQPNIWALVIVALSLVPFLIAIKQSKLSMLLLGLAILMLTLGSVFLFMDENGRPEVNLGLASIVSIFCGLFIWMATVRGLRAQGIEPIFDPDSLVGMVGETRTEVHYSGSVLAGGELWSARSDTPIPSGTRVRIIGREGFILSVKKLESLSK